MSNVKGEESGTQGPDLGGPGQTAPNKDQIEELSRNAAAPDAVQTPTTAKHPLTPTRISGSWTAVVAAVIILIVLVVFIAENTQRSTVNFVGFHGHAPTAVVLLIAAIAGAVLVIIVGTARILQLRSVARHSESRGRTVARRLPDGRP